jgi:hypothetical protein
MITWQTSGLHEVIIKTYIAKVLIGRDHLSQPFIRRGLPNAMKRSRQKYHYHLPRIIAQHAVNRWSACVGFAVSDVSAPQQVTSLQFLQSVGRLVEIFSKCANLAYRLLFRHCRNMRYTRFSLWNVVEKKKVCTLTIT